MEAEVPCFERPQNIFPRCLGLVNQRDLLSDVEASPRPPHTDPCPNLPLQGGAVSSSGSLSSLYARPWLVAQFSSPAVGRLSGGGSSVGASGGCCQEDATPPLPGSPHLQYPQDSLQHFNFLCNWPGNQNPVRGGAWPSLDTDAFSVWVGWKLPTLM